MTYPNWTEQDLQEAKERMRGGVDGTRKARTNGARMPGKSGPKAGSNPAPSSPSFKSKWEASFANHLELQLKAKVIRSYRYEGLTLRLAKGKYHRTDFVIGHLDGTVELAQVKGWHKNLRAGIAGLKWAAQLYPMFTWTMKRWTGTGWDSNYVDI